MANHAKLPLFKFSGTGKVTKSAVGRYIAKVIQQSNTTAIELPTVRSKVKALLWLHLQKDFTEEHFENYINCLLEELKINRNSKIRRGKIVEFTNELFSYFERQLIFYNDLDSIDSSIPDDFLK